MEDKPGRKEDEMDTAKLHFIILSQFDGQVIMKRYVLRECYLTLI